MPDYRLRQDPVANDPISFGYSEHMVSILGL